MRKFTLLTATLAVVFGLILSGCSETKTSTSASTTPAPSNASFNDADIEFVQSMIPHHEQAVTMSQMAGAAAAEPKVKKLAQQIKAAQAPEIKQMKAWLSEWNVQEADVAGHMAMGHGTDGMDMPGMMDAAQMSDLDDANGSAFDAMFLTMMVDHHEGAVEMAQTVKSDGKNPEVRDLADAIITGQTKEIATMKSWLKA